MHLIHPCIHSLIDSLASSFTRWLLRSVGRGLAGQWGTCALGGLGDNILLQERGQEIDNHDTVIRMGHSPVKGFENFVGSKSSVVWSRKLKTMMAPPGHAPPDHAGAQFYIEDNNQILGMPFLEVMSKDLLVRILSELAQATHRNIA